MGIGPFVPSPRMLAAVAGILTGALLAGLTVLVVTVIGVIA